MISHLMTNGMQAVMDTGSKDFRPLSSHELLSAFRHFHF
jgi:hypothetical protein